MCPISSLIMVRSASHVDCIIAGQLYQICSRIGRMRREFLSKSGYSRVIDFFKSTGEYMRVFLLKDVPNVGMAGEIVKVSDGYAANLLFPRKAAVEVTRDNEGSLKARVIERERRKDVVATQTSMLAERIKSTEVVIRRKIHDDNKLYGSVGQTDIVEQLAEKGIKVSKSQVLIDKSIKTRGTHTVTIKLTSRLTPQLTVRVVAEAA